MSASLAGVTFAKEADFLAPHYAFLTGSTEPLMLHFCASCSSQQENRE